MAKKKKKSKQERKEGVIMVAKSLIIPQENFDKLLEAMIKEEKEEDNKSEK